MNGSPIKLKQKLSPKAAVAKKKRDVEKQVRLFAEAIADGKSFTTKEESS